MEPCRDPSRLPHCTPATWPLARILLFAIFIVFSRLHKTVTARSPIRRQVLSFTRFHVNCYIFLTNCALQIHYNLCKLKGRCGKWSLIAVCLISLFILRTTTDRPSNQFQWNLDIGPIIFFSGKCTRKINYAKR